jgi:protein phosphatase
VTVIVLPDPALVILVGASGSGKSTFAARHFAAAEILSTDAFRARLGRGEADQTASAGAFAALYRGLAMRLGAGRLAVVDATNVRPTARRALVRLARTVANVPIVAIVLDLAELDCLAGNRARPGRAVGSEVIHRQWVALHRSLLTPGGLAGEGFAAVHVLSSAAARDGAVVARSATAPAPRQGADDPGAAGLP